MSRGWEQSEAACSTGLRALSASDAMPGSERLVMPVPAPPSPPILSCSYAVSEGIPQPPPCWRPAHASCPGASGVGGCRCRRPESTSEASASLWLPLGAGMVLARGAGRCLEAGMLGGGLSPVTLGLRHSRKTFPFPYLAFGPHRLFPSVGLCTHLALWTCWSCGEADMP